MRHFKIILHYPFIGLILKQTNQLVWSYMSSLTPFFIFAEDVFTNNFWNTGNKKAKGRSTSTEVGSESREPFTSYRHSTIIKIIQTLTLNLPSTLNTQVNSLTSGELQA